MGGKQRQLLASNGTRDFNAALQFRLNGWESQIAQVRGQLHTEMKAQNVARQSGFGHHAVANELLPWQSVLACELRSVRRQDGLCVDRSVKNGVPKNQAPWRPAGAAHSLNSHRRTQPHSEPDIRWAAATCEMFVCVKQVGSPVSQRLIAFVSWGISGTVVIETERTVPFASETVGKDAVHSGRSNGFLAKWPTQQKNLLMRSAGPILKNPHHLSIAG